jgi:hypothetical protein
MVTGVKARDIRQNLTDCGKLDYFPQPVARRGHSVRVPIVGSVTSR